MDTDENVINNFADTLRNHHEQKTISLYTENHGRSSRSVEKHEIKDVISGVAKQLKAIQNADSIKKSPSVRGIPSLVKKSNFLPLHLVPVEQLPTMHSHKFETQCVLDTQLINIIQDAEAIIDVEKGITQEFDTTFCHKDTDNCNNKPKDGCELFNVTQETSLLQAAYNKNGKSSHDKSSQGSNEANRQLHKCVMSDNKLVKQIGEVENGMTQEFNITFCHKDDNTKENNNSYENLENSNIYNQNDTVCHELLESANDIMQQDNQMETVYRNIADIQIFGKTNDQSTLSNANICAIEENTMTFITIKNLEPKTNAQIKNTDTYCDNFDTGSNFYFDTCEDDNNNFSQNELFTNSKFYVNEPKSPILNKIQPKVKSLPLIFKLESFEKFENIALPIVENHDYETAKRVIKSQILNRDLFINTHAEAVLSDRDKDIQKGSPVLKYSIKSESSFVRYSDSKHTIKEDSMLFSSDEDDDGLNNSKQLPLMCTLQNAFDCKSEILDKSMYVGFQTASNKPLQISTVSYCKAKSIFDNITDTNGKSPPGSNFDDLMVSSTKTYRNNHDNVNFNNVINFNDADIADFFKSAHCEHVNASEKTINNSKDRNTRQDTNIQNADVVQPPRFTETKDGKFENITEIIQIDSHILDEFNKNLIPDINVQNKNLNEGDIINIFTTNNFAVPTNKNIIGFKTANNKTIKVSTQALKKTKNIFENIDHDTLFRKSDQHSSKNTCLDILTSSASSENHPSILNNKDLIAEVKDIQKAKEVFKLADATCCQLDDDDVVHLEVICDNKENEIQNNIVSKSFQVNKNITSTINQSELYPACHFEPNSVLQDLKSVSTKPVKISKQALAKTRKNLYDKATKKEFNEDLNENPNNSDSNKVSGAFVGFTTASNKPVNICESALAKSKMLFQDIDKSEEIYAGVFNIPTSNTVVQSSNAFQGFTTASNKPVKICETALAKTKNIFQDIDAEITEKINDSVFTIPTCNTALICHGFKTASNKAIPISDKQLAKCKDIFQDIIDTKVLNVEINHALDETPASVAESTKSTPQLQGFRTASNKLVKVSKKALYETNKIFQDIDINHKESKTISDDFDTILKEKQPYPIANTSFNTNCPGYKIASNKSLKITEELSKRKKIFQDIGFENHKESIVLSGDPENILKQESKVLSVNFDSIFKEKLIVNGSENAICGFKTAGDKPVKISALALEKSKKIFENMNTDCEKEQIREEVTEKLPTNSRNSFTGFHTASNKSVKILENSLLKSRQVLQNIDLDVKNENCTFKNISKLENVGESLHNFGFKTASNTDINVSVEAFKRSRNLFNNLDESLVASADSKLIPNDVLSENEILEDFNSEMIKDFEETVYTEDFIKKETPKSKRSGSPILSCPKPKKRKKFETPVVTNKFVAPIIKKITIKTSTSNLYKFNEDYKKIKKYSLKDIYEIKKLNMVETVDPYVLNFKFQTLLDFEFAGGRNDIDSDRWTTDKIKTFFTDSVNKRIIPEGWMENHLKMIIWKLVCYEIRFPEVMKNVCTVKNVLEQLKYRYKRELYNVERPALRKILEKDEVSSKRMILCVAGLYVDGLALSSVTKETTNIELLLTDGWYTIKATTDRMIDRLVNEGKIGVGTKLVIHGAELLSCDQGIAPWEDTSAVRLKIFGNSTRRAKWDARLGFHGNGAILTRLSAVKPEGGKISHLRTLVTRVYPTLYIEKFPDGSTLTRSERLEHIYQMKHETERQIQMEKLYEELERFSDQESQDSEGQCVEDRAMASGSQVSRLMKKSRDRDEFRANLTSSQAYLLQQHELKQKDKLVQALQEKFRELVKKRGLDTPRNVVSLVKFRVADVETGGITKAMTTLWKPNESIQDMLTEGTWIDLYNVVPTSVRYSEIQISAGRQSVFRIAKLKETDKLKTLTRSLKRQCYTIKDLQNTSMNIDYNEVDTVGLIFMIEPQTKEFETERQAFQNVYLTNEDKNIMCVNFWGGIKKFGFQNILDTGQVVTCVNLQKRAGNTRKNIPQYRATEFSYFTKTSKVDAVRKMAEDLEAKFCSLDKRKFLDDCVALKNNYHNIKCGNTENVSPYRLNASDYNVYKNKVFIDSPLVKCTDINLNLSGLDFESTFKQTDTQDLSPQMLLRKRKVNEKIAKLKMYGEPPPLSTIHIKNKSSNTVKAFISPFTPSVASSSALPRNWGKCNIEDSRHSNEEVKVGIANLPQNRVDCESGVTISHVLPQNEGVHNIYSSPVLSINRKKRVTINPVKLNFSNAIETSITDPFAEDFDGSPPLSLDVNFVA